MDDPAFQSLDTNTVIVTANRRLATYLHHQYGNDQKSQDKIIWETPNILPLSTWLKLLWYKVNDTCWILSNIQEHALWKKISRQNWASIPTLQQAWESAQAWNIDWNILKESRNEAAQCFYQWSQNFINHCRQEQCLTNAEIPGKLLLTKSLSAHLPKKILLAGFDDFPPVMTQFFNHVQHHSQIETLKMPSLISSVKRVELENTEAELIQMAQWALKEHSNNPQKKIACVIPKLTSIRHQVVRIFSDLFPNHSAFNISAGQTLNEFFIIQTALYSIQEKWESILQSPYLTLSDDDKDMAAQADKIRRSKNVLHCETSDLLPIFTALDSRFPKTTFLKRWNLLLQYKKTIPKQQKPSQWMQTFTEILERLQWPGNRTLNSTEHQLLQRWLNALEELAQCDRFFEEITHEHALALLNHHIGQIIFQPKSEEAPIQILGILETAGISFDALWITGLDHESWPPIPTPNPFLPYELQIRLDMPHASAKRELRFTEQTMKRLLSNAHEIYLSSSKMDGDRRLIPSPLILPYKEYSFIQKSIKKDTPLPFPSDNTWIETFTDNTGLPLCKNKKIKGGTTVFKYQALCPFKAYASFRLSANTLETPRLGLSPQLRGQLLHQILEIFWRKNQSQDNLLGMSDEQLTEILLTTINTVIESQTIEKSEQTFLLIEKNRLLKILRDWLSLEKKRSPFQVVSQESLQNITIGSLSFECRIDRIDKLENGTQLVIDYKSGYTHIQSWFGERLSDPQLPIYCIFGNQKIYDGIVFAQVRAGAMQFKGIISEKASKIEDPGIISINNVENDNNIYQWDTLTTHWKVQLEKLSNDICDGNAKVDPAELACEFCELKPLCRVNECQT